MSIFHESRTSAIIVYVTFFGSIALSCILFYAAHKIRFFAWQTKSEPRTNSHTGGQPANFREELAAKPKPFVRQLLIYLTAPFLHLLTLLFNPALMHGLKLVLHNRTDQLGLAVLMCLVIRMTFCLLIVYQLEIRLYRHYGQSNFKIESRGATFNTLFVGFMLSWVALIEQSRFPETYLFGADIHPNTPDIALIHSACCMLLATVFLTAAGMVVALGWRRSYLR